MRTRDLIALIVLATPMAVPLALAESAPSAVRKSVDFEAAFAEGFPAVADEHHVADWKLYTALVDDDAVAYAARVHASIGRHIEEARGKGYQMQQAEAAIRQDKRLRAAFDQQRQRIRTMVLYSDVIEDLYPASIKLRWRWRGLRAVSRVRSVDANGNRVGEAEASAVTTPLELGLEFVGAEGRILWTASSTAPPRRQ